MSSSERAAFQVEVASVEEWFKVKPLSAPIPIADQMYPTEPSFRKVNAAIHRCAGCCKEGNYPH